MSGILSYFCEYALCMLVSLMITGTPLAGAFVCTAAHLVFFCIKAYSNRYRKQLPLMLRIIAPLMLASLLAVSLQFFFKTETLENRPALISLIVICVTIIGIGPITRRMYRTASKSSRGNSFGLPLSIAVAAILISLHIGLTSRLLNGGSAIIIAGFFVTALASFADARAERSLTSLFIHREKPSITYDQVKSLRPYRSLRVITVLCTAAMILTAAALFLLHMFLYENIITAAAIAVVCLLAGRIAGKIVSARRRKSQRYNPAFALLGGVAVCFASSASLIIVLGTGHMPSPVIASFISTATAFASSFCASSLSGMEASIPNVFRFFHVGIPEGYSAIRLMQRRMAGLIGEFLSVVSLLSARLININWNPAGFTSSLFNTFIITPAAALSFLAFTSVFTFPLSRRITEKLERFLRLSDSGKENAKLKALIEPYLTGKRMQPFFIPSVKALLRLFVHYRICGADNLIEDDDNPLVILANHGEFIGPVVCETRLPVFVRPWIISNIVASVDEIAQYVYKYTFVRQKWLPSSLKMPFSRLTGRMSKMAMDQVEAISVFRDEPIKLRKTFRDSCDALEAGDNLLIFPENPNAPELKKIGYIKDGLCPLFDGFAMLAPSYYSRTKKRMRFLPIFINKKEKTVTIGRLIVFDPKSDPTEERRRIILEADNELHRLMNAQETG